MSNVESCKIHHTGRKRREQRWDGKGRKRRVREEVGEER